MWPCDGLLSLLGSLDAKAMAQESQLPWAVGLVEMTTTTTCAAEEFVNEIRKGWEAVS